MTIAYKLFRKMKCGRLAPLFINMRQRLDLDTWYEAGFHPKVGYAVRRGWHCTLKPGAPHLSNKGRVWCKVEVEDFTYFTRPESQGGKWLLAKKLKVLEEL